MSHQATTSPGSSEPVDSTHATPATKLSVFSPESTRLSTGSSGRGIVRPRVPPPFDLQVPSGNQNYHNARKDPATAPYHDPFTAGSPLTSTTTRSSSDPSKLSPAAPAFTPASVLESPAFIDQSNVPCSKSNMRKTANQILDSGNRISPAQISPGKLNPKASVSSLDSPSIPCAMGAFSSDEKSSRYIMVHFAKGTTARMVEQRLKSDHHRSLKELLCGELTANGLVLAKFTDLRDAAKALQEFDPQKAQYISLGDYYAGRPGISHTSEIPSIFEGQLIVILTMDNRSAQFQEDTLRRSIIETLEQFGDIMAFRTLLAESPRLILHVEFFDTTAAQKVLNEKKSVMIPTCNLTFESYKPDSKSLKQASSRYIGPIIIGQETPTLSQTFDRMNLNQQAGASLPQTSDGASLRPLTHSNSYTNRKESLGVHTPSRLVDVGHGSHGPLSPYSPSWNSSAGGYAIPSPMWSPFGPGTIGQERGSPTVSQDYYAPPRGDTRIGSRQPLDIAGCGHNVVEVNRIRAGLDVRTTIMLRNIPNKIDQAMLKDIIDETSLGKYDFMYLRIDFANNCNVGYAFINFADPIWIVDFVNARAGHRWNRYNSDKVAEVSYATIQGRDCLIQKFRNSSVMLEHPSFRPKLFRTSPGSLVGTEEEFPGPDNPSKMRRSVENAEHVGLFAPRAGQNFRDEQRRRRSQFDRGTRLSEVNEMYERSKANAYHQTNLCRSLRAIPHLETVYQELNAPYY